MAVVPVVGCGPVARGPIELAVTEVDTRTERREVLGVTTSGETTVLADLSETTTLGYRTAWSFDGSRLSVGQTGNSENRIYAMSSGEVETVETYSRLCWAPDSLTIAFPAKDPFDLVGPAIVIRDLVSGSERTIGQGDAYSCSWSPDGRQLVALGTGVDSRPELAVVVFDVATGDASFLATDVAYDPLTLDAPVWSPRGDRIAVRARVDRTQTMIVMDPASGTSDLLQPGAAHIHNPSWSPSGRYLLIRTSDGDFGPTAVTIVDMDEREPDQHVRDARTLVWSPDGDRVAQTVERPDGPLVRIVDEHDDVLWVSPRSTASSIIHSPVWRPLGDWSADL